MKKRIQSAVTVLIILLLCYSVLTPMGAVRLSVLCHGYPIEAVTLQVRKATPQDTGATLDNSAHSTVYTITRNVPYEYATGGHLENWIVYKFLFFHFADYYGYC